MQPINSKPPTHQTFDHKVMVPSMHPVFLPSCSGCVYHLEEYHACNPVNAAHAREQYNVGIWFILNKRIAENNLIDVLFISMAWDTKEPNCLYLNMCTHPKREQGTKVCRCMYRRSRKQLTPTERKNEHIYYISCSECKRVNSRYCPVFISTNIHPDPLSYICDSFLADTIPLHRNPVDRVFNPDILIDSLFLIVP